MDVQWAGPDMNLIRAQAQELVGLQHDIILANSTAVTAAFQREMRTIPIVFAGAADPVASGIAGFAPRGILSICRRLLPEHGRKHTHFLVTVASCEGWGCPKPDAGPQCSPSPIGSS